MTSEIMPSEIWAYEGIEQPGWSHVNEGEGCVKYVLHRLYQSAEDELAEVVKENHKLRETISSLQTQIYELGGTPKRTEKSK